MEGDCIVRFIVDTCAIVNLWFHSDPTFHPHMRPLLQKLLENDQLIISDHVLKEVTDLLLLKFLKAHANIAPSTKTIQIEANLLRKRFSNLIRLNETKNRADPWIIAFAKIYESPVLTDEGLTSAKRMKWLSEPDKNLRNVAAICDRLKIPVYNSHTFLAILIQ